MSAFSNTLYVRTKSRYSVRPAGAAWKFLPDRFPGAHQTVTKARGLGLAAGDGDVVAVRRGQAGSSDPSELHLDYGGLSFRSAGPERRSKLLFNRSYSQ